MAFDIKTAKPVSQGFDISTARPENSVSLEELQRQEQPQTSIPIFGPMNRTLRTSPSAAVRSFLQGQGYQQGAVHPERVKTFEELESNVPFVKEASEAVSKLAYPGSPLFQAMGGVTPGKALDIATNPFDILMGLLSETKAGEGVVRGVGSAIKSPFRMAERMRMSSKGTKVAPELIDDLVGFFGKRDLSDKKRALSNLRSVLRSSTDEEITSLLGNNKREIESLLKELEDVSIKSASEIKEVLPTAFGKKSREYFSTREALIAKAGKIPTNVTTRGELYPLIRNIAQENRLFEGYPGLVRKARSPIESKIVSLMEDLSDPKRFNEPIAYEDLKRIRNDVWNTIPKQMRVGSAPYTSDEHIIASFDEDFTGLLEDIVPGIKELNSKYAPFIKLKREAYRLFNPKRELGGAPGSSMIQRFGKGKSKIGEQTFLETLQKELGINLTGRPSTIRKSVESLKGERRLIKPTLKAKEASELGRIRELEEETIKSARAKEAMLMGERQKAEEAFKMARLRRNVSIGVGAATVGKPITKILVDLLGLGQLLPKGGE